MECAKHACKCYRASLEKLAAGNPTHKGKGGLTEKMRKKLTSSARCAIKMHSKDPNRDRALQQFKSDLVNGPYHCFGHHGQCSPDFYQNARESQRYSTTTDENYQGVEQTHRRI